METPGISAEQVEGYIRYGTNQGWISLGLFLFGFLGVVSLRSNFGGGIVIAIIQALSTGLRIPQLYYQFCYLFTGSFVFHARKYMEKGQMLSVKTGALRPLLSTAGALGLNWVFAFMPEYQLLGTFDVWADIVAQLSWDVSSEASLMYFWTNTPLFGAFLIVKTVLLSWGVWSWITDYKHFNTVTQYAEFCDAATGCNPTEEWLLANPVEEEGEEVDGEEVDGEDVDAEESADESADEVVAEPCFDFFGNEVACEDGSADAEVDLFGL